MFVKNVIFLLCALIGQTIGLRCYTCAFSSVDTDQSCLTISETTRSVNCPYTYCTILRQELLDPPGAVASFMRGCSDSPDYLNHEITDSTFRTFYRACTNDLCNIGNGIESVVGGGLQVRPQYNGENLLVPGTGSNSAGAGNPQATTLSALFMILMFYVI